MIVATTCRNKVWNVFEHPESSTLARVVSLISVFAIIASTTIFCMETVTDKKMRVGMESEEVDHDVVHTMPEIIGHHHVRFTSPSFHILPGQYFINFSIHYTKGERSLMFVMESFCVSWFVFEFLVRALFAPDRYHFWMKPMNLIDAAAIMPYFFTLFLDRIIKSTIRDTRPQIATVLRMVRVLRTLRILKLSRYSRGLRILGTTLYRSARVLTLLVIFQMVLAITFGSFVYYLDLGIGFKFYNLSSITYVAYFLPVRVKRLECHLKKKITNRNKSTQFQKVSGGP